MKVLLVSIIIMSFSQSIMANGLTTAKCSDCEEQIKFALEAQKKIKDAIRKGIIKVKRGTKASPCGEECRYTDPLNADELERLTKAYKNTQDVMLGAWEEMKKREIAARLAKCNKDICPK